MIDKMYQFVTELEESGTSQEIGANSPLVSFPSHNRDSDPQSTQPVSTNYDDNDDIVIVKDDVDQYGFRVKWTLKYSRVTGLKDAKAA